MRPDHNKLVIEAKDGLAPELWLWTCRVPLLDLMDQTFHSKVSPASGKRFLPVQSSQ
ncbi:hypothetical protein M378DRAFT_17108 [Amanita muscaria Koide BX008]|uniref:Uncharacterized protein n=1 Tax=Amanita muscaria (strain Koide BX008) TaxID=946122 RepID=A0A0C2WID0_AMAMK|nr:hypothetical protein M378DRAFT_17108 [Amanita muscaria Koide BX008]